MQLRIESREGLRIVHLDGALDALGTEAFHDELGPIRNGDRLVLDLEPLTFVDSAGLHALFKVARAAKEVGARVGLVVPPGSPVRRVVEIVHLADVAPLFDTLEAAVSDGGL